MQNNKENSDILASLKQEKIDALQKVVGNIQKFEDALKTMRFPSIRHTMGQTRKALAQIPNLARGGMWDRDSANTITHRIRMDNQTREQFIENKKSELIGKLVLMKHDLDASPLDDETKNKVQNYMNYQWANIEGKQVEENMPVESAQELTAYLQAEINKLNS